MNANGLDVSNENSHIFGVISNDWLRVGYSPHSEGFSVHVTLQCGKVRISPFSPKVVRECMCLYVC